MLLMGALLNQRDHLARLAELRAQLLSRPVEKSSHGRAQPKKVQLRYGAIQRAVIQVLRAAEAPMRATDVHATVERLLSSPVSKDSVNSCLSIGARGEEAQFERVGYGLYRLRKA
jgi:hypothetical protein